MASSKEALAIILDIGPNMVLNKHLTESLQLIKMILQRKLFSESKDEVMLILLGTSMSKNQLFNGSEYNYISVEKPLAQVNFEFIHYIQNFDLDFKGRSADFVDAIVVAMDELKRNTDGKKMYGSKRIILFSNLMEKFNNDQLDDIVASLKESHFEFNYIGPCLQDDESEIGDVKSHQANGEVKNQKEGQEVVRRILDQVDGDYFSLKELLPCLSFIQSRCINSTAWKANLKIGSSLEIPICLYTRIKEMKSKSFRNVYSHHTDAEIERSRSYHLNDEKQTEIDKSDIIDGNRYGNTIVPFSVDDKEAMKLKTEKCFKVLGFTKYENVKRYQYFGDSVWVCVAEKGNEVGQLSLSALMRALFETNMIAIVRRVYMNNGQVKIGCLIPHIKDKYECLFYVDLPFAEDLRQYTFSSLPLNDSCTAANKIFKCTDEQLEAVDKLIDAMDLSGPKSEDEDNTNELLKPKQTFNPYLQRLYQCIEHRALCASSPLPLLHPSILSCLQTPQHIKDASSSILDKIKQMFPIKPSENVTNNKSVTNLYAGVHPTSAMDKDVLNADNERLNKEIAMKEVFKDTAMEVGSNNPIENFHDMILQNKDSHHAACEQLQNRIKQFIVDSFGPSLYGKAVQCLKALRLECVKATTVGKYNDFMKDLKNHILDKQRINFWPEIKINGLGLIQSSECQMSQVGNEEAEEFLSIDVENIKGGEQQDVDNLLQELE